MWSRQVVRKRANGTAPRRSLTEAQRHGGGEGGSDDPEWVVRWPSLSEMVTAQSEPVGPKGWWRMKLCRRDAKRNRIQLGLGLVFHGGARMWLFKMGSSHATSSTRQCGRERRLGEGPKAPGLSFNSMRPAERPDRGRSPCRLRRSRSRSRWCPKRRGEWRDRTR